MRRKNTDRKANRQRLPNAERSQERRLDQRNSLLCTAAICLLHGAALALLFDPLRGIVDGQPIIEQDWGLHFHHLKSLETFWLRDKITWGYNPFFIAGYPSNTIQDLSIKLFEFLAIGLSMVALTPIQWFKISAFLANLCVPWVMYLAMRNFLVAEDSKYLTATAAALLGTIYWWNSLPREMFFYGMIGFPVASYLVVLGVSLVYRFGGHPSAFGLLHFAWFVFAMAILPLHVQSIIILLPPVLTLFILGPSLLRSQLILLVVGAGLLSSIINLFWLYPAISHRGDDIAADIVAQLPLFADTDFFTFILDYIGPQGYWTFRPSFIEKGFRLALLVLGAFGTWWLLQSKKRDLGVMLAATLITLFLVSYFGALVPSVRPWQPLRFKVPFDLFLAVGAAYAINHWLIHRAPASPFVPIVLVCGSLAFLINLVQTESTGQLQIRSQLIPELREIVDWIGRATPADARVLFEESGDETGFVYDRVYLSSLVPHLTGRQLIGGPINLYNDRHHFAEFHSGRLFKRDIAAFSDEELRNYLSLYNIGAVVAFHPASLKRFQSMPGLLTLDRRIGPVHLLKVNQTLSWFVQGEGRVKASLNRIEITEIKGNPLILKYHWIAGLHSEPAAKIEPVKLADDPIPFIKIIDPPASLVLKAK